MIKKIIFPLVLAAALVSCGKSGVVLPAATGTRFEVLVVMNDSHWKAPAGRAVFDMFNQDTPNLPQPEPMMDITQVRFSIFGDMLKPTRNILFVEIEPRFMQPKIIYAKDTWSRPQAIVKIQAENDSIMELLVKQDGQRILNYFLESERNRSIAIGRNYLNRKAVKEVEEQFGVRIDIPSELNKVQKTEDFYWITNDHPRIRKDLVIYSYPYTDKNMLTREALIARRDTVMKHNIPGEFEGSFMGTEIKFHEPEFRAFNLNDTYCAELAGLWKIFDGGSMGGPFFSHTRIDEINKRVITVETFVFAPGNKKRNHIRQMEAVVYSTMLPQEINAIKEISVTAEQN